MSVTNRVRRWSPAEAAALFGALTLVGAGHATAQQPAGQRQTTEPACRELVALGVDSARAASLRPDVIIHASATADQMTFTGQPRASVRFTGCGIRDTVHVLERTNLPSPVVSGSTYRNVRIAVEILAYIDVECVLAQLKSAVAPADTTRRTNADPCRRKPE